MRGRASAAIRHALEVGHAAPLTVMDLSHPRPVRPASRRGVRVTARVLPFVAALLLGCGAAGEPSAPEPRVADASTPVATPTLTATSQHAEVGMDEAASGASSPPRARRRSAIPRREDQTPASPA